MFFLSPKSRRLKTIIPAVLYQKSIYYQNLSVSEKELFDKRVLEFILYKEFHKMGNFEITDEMKIEIAATAIQITFGFSREYEYKAFKSIVVSQKDYLSMLTHQEHKGETNPAKEYVALSWERFQEGIKDPHDSISVGLHEFAHAYFFNNVKGYINESFDKTISTWHKTVTKLAKERSTHEFLRKYAFANRMEFFAVTMEYFFETPNDLEKYLPELYLVLTTMLKQDPLKLNYGISRGSFYTMS